MEKYTSLITFVYYQDFDRGCRFMEEVLQLKCVMDQGFAKVYKVSEKAFVGTVKTKDNLYRGGKLISLTTKNVEEEYIRVRDLDVYDLTELQTFEEIPLTSFFFKDFEGHNFEIQQFLNKNDTLRFWYWLYDDFLI